METLRTLAVLAGLGLVWNGYQDNPLPGPSPDPAPAPSPAPVIPGPKPVPNPSPGPSPTPGPVIPVPGGTLTIQIVAKPEDQPAPAPTNAAVAAASASIRTMLKGHPEDAIKLARTFKGWSELIARDSTLKSTADFQQAYIGSTLALLRRHNMAGKYQINPIIDATILESFRAANPALVEGNAVASAEWSPAAAQAAAQAFDAIAHQAFQAFTDSVVPVPPK